MKNSTLWGLTLAGIRLPFITMPTSTHSCKQTFSKIRFSRSTSSFLFDRSMNSHILIQKSKFSEVISSPIHLESSDYAIFPQVETQKRNYDIKDSVVIEETSFIHCDGASDNGGAVTLEKRALFAKIDKCSFQYCITSKSGGAIYAALNNITILRTCFLECQAQESGHAYLIKLNDIRSRSSISDVSVTQSSSVQSGRSACFLYIGNYHIQFNNLSNNHALAMGAALTTINCKNITLTFSEIMNSSSLNILRLSNTRGYVLMMFDNVIGNNADKSIISSSGGNNIVHSVFAHNFAPEFLTGNLAFLQFAYCAIDKNYTFTDIEYVKTPYVAIRRSPEPNPLRFAFAGVCRVLSDSEGLGSEDTANDIFESVPQSDRQFIRLFRKRAYKQFLSNLKQSLRKLRLNRQTGKTETSSQQHEEIPEEVEPTQAMIDIGSGIAAVRLTPRPITPRRAGTPSQTPRKRRTMEMTPSMPFSPSSMFMRSSTFRPSLQFTAQREPKPNLVPYVLYSTAGFVIMAVMTTFLFLKGGETGYNLVAPSESAESRISDYASSTSTTVTLTGESSSVV